MLALVLFIAFALIIYLVLSLALHRRIRVQARLDEAVSWGRTKVPEVKAGGKERDWVLKRLIQRMGTRWAGDRTNQGLQRIQLKLSQAGAPGHLSGKEWMGVRMLAVLGGFGLGMVFAVASGLKPTSLLICVVLALLGWVGPDFWLSRRVQQRQLLILRQLPSALDLLTVSVEAGLGFDQAVDKLAQKLSGPLADEFGRALREIQLGSSRAQALQRFAARTGVEAVRTFVSAVVQSERLGVGMGQVLRVQSAEVRRKRRMDAQERAMKAPIKMLFPLVLFVFPALFIVILGPAAIHIVEMFKTTG